MKSLQMERAEQLDPRGLTQRSERRRRRSRRRPQQRRVSSSLTRLPLLYTKSKDCGLYCKLLQPLHNFHPHPRDALGSLGAAEAPSARRPRLSRGRRGAMPARATLSTDNSFGESLVRHSQVSRGSLGESLIEDAAAATVVPPRCEPPDMWAWSHAALYAHYACIGVVNGLLTQALLPYCLYVAHGEPNTCATLSTFVNLPWGFKLLYGALSDCVPICGRHRKPYLVLGWLLTLVISLALALLPRLDLQLASSLFLAMTVAYLLADCAADAALVGISTREPAESRGSILSTAYFIRFTANILSAAVVGAPPARPPPRHPPPFHPLAPPPFQCRPCATPTTLPRAPPGTNPSLAPLRRGSLPVQWPTDVRQLPLRPLHPATHVDRRRVRRRLHGSHPALLRRAAGSRPATVAALARDAVARAAAAASGVAPHPRAHHDHRSLARHQPGADQCQ